MSLSPITVFAFNRPRHLRLTIESLKNNILAQESELYIYSDKQNNEADRIDVEEVRRYIRTINGFKKVIIIERRENLGLAKSIISGVSEIVNKYGKIVVIEDDLLLSKGFLKFINESLLVYQNYKKVGMVSGYVFPLKNYPDAPFFLKGGNCWGWGTWKRTWNLLEKNPKPILSYILKNNLSDEFDYHGYAGYIEALKKIEKGTLNTWAILWYGTQFINHLYGYHPSCSLVQNIGFDGTGTHSGVTNIYKTKTVSSVKVINVPVCDNETVRRELTAFYKTKRLHRSWLIHNILSKFKLIIDSL